MKTLNNAIHVTVYKDDEDDSLDEQLQTPDWFVEPENATVFEAVTMKQDGKGLAIMFSGIEKEAFIETLRKCFCQIFPKWQGMEYE